MRVFILCAGVAAILTGVLIRLDQPEPKPVERLQIAKAPEPEKPGLISAQAAIPTSKPAEVKIELPPPPDMLPPIVVVSPPVVDPRNDLRKDQQRVTASVEPPQVEKPRTEVARTDAPRLVELAQKRLELRDINSARMLLIHAGDHREALTLLADTYDPAKLSGWGVMGTRGDAAKANALREKAAALR